jgi:hypothetical protein
MEIEFKPGEVWAITVVGRVRSNGRSLAVDDDHDEDFDLNLWRNEKGVTLTRLYPGS